MVVGQVEENLYVPYNLPELEPVPCVYYWSLEEIYQESRKHEFHPT